MCIYMEASLKIDTNAEQTKQDSLRIAFNNQSKEVIHSYSVAATGTFTYLSTMFHENFPQIY